jgi:hypothetical protein
MASNNVTPPSAEARLRCLQEVCAKIAVSINTARRTLRDHAEDADAVFMVADALDGVGWLAERGRVVAGAARMDICGNADGWIFGECMDEMVARLGKEAVHG